MELTQRACITCSNPFWSEGIHNRMVRAVSVAVMRPGRWPSCVARPVRPSVGQKERKAMINYRIGLLVPGICDALRRK